MEFQNQSGTEVINVTAKENKNLSSQNGDAKKESATVVKPGNSKTDIKDLKQATVKSANLKAEGPKTEPKTENETHKEDPKVEQLSEDSQSKIEIKPELTLEAKLRAVKDLNRLSIQRLALIARMKLLDDFEVNLMEENDELENNPYRGCKLIIRDDRNREFVTNTPGLIRMVATFIFNACEEKLEEIESSIIFPNA